MFGVAIRWYCLFRGEKLPQVYDKAAKISRMGLAKATSDKDFILDRLRDLEEGEKTIMKKEHLFFCEIFNKKLIHISSY